MIIVINEFVKETSIVNFKKGYLYKDTYAKFNNDFKSNLNSRFLNTFKTNDLSWLTLKIYFYHNIVIFKSF